MFSLSLPPLTQVAWGRLPMHHLLGPLDRPRPATGHFPPCRSSPSGFMKASKMKTVQFKDPINSVINSTSCDWPSLPNTTIVLQLLKACKSSPPATKPKSSLKLIKPEVTNTPFHCYSPGHCCPEVSLPKLFWYHWHHVRDIYYQDLPFHSPCPACPVEGTHRVPRADWVHPLWYGQQRWHSSCFPAYQVGIIPKIPMYTRWYLAHMPQP